MLWPLAELFLLSLQPVARVESERSLATMPHLNWWSSQMSQGLAGICHIRKGVRILSSATLFHDAAGHQEPGDFRGVPEAKGVSQLHLCDLNAILFSCH